MYNCLFMTVLNKIACIVYDLSYFVKIIAYSVMGMYIYEQNSIFCSFWRAELNAKTWHGPDGVIRVVEYVCDWDGAVITALTLQCPLQVYSLFCLFFI